MHKIKNIRFQLLADFRKPLKKVIFDYFHNGRQKWISQEKEIYERGDAAAVLLYHSVRQTVILTRQFRLPVYLKDGAPGQLTEVCAGMLDGGQPEDCIRKEIMEETGYIVHTVKKIAEAYTSPGAITEKIHLFIAEYSPSAKAGPGGGLPSENEDIEVIEIPFREAWSMLEQGAIRDMKTIVLLQYARIHRLCPGNPQECAGT